MSVKFMANKRYLENINGLKNFKESNIDYDSGRNKNEQVHAGLNDNGKKYYLEDSMQKFINRMPNNHNSIFDLLNVDLQALQNKNVKNLSRPNKITKGFNVRHRVSRGITSKLFDYDKAKLSNSYDNILGYNKLNVKKHTKKHGKREKRGKRGKRGKVQTHKKK